MLTRNGEGIFAAFGHPKGVDAYYAEVAAENDVREAAAAAELEERRAAAAVDPKIYDLDLPVFVAGGESDNELIPFEEPWLIVEGTDASLSWSEFVLDGLRLDEMLRDNVAALKAMNARYDAAADAFYPEFVPPSPEVSEYTRFLIGPDLYGTEYSRREGVLSNFIGSTSVSQASGLFQHELGLIA